MGFRVSPPCTRRAGPSRAPHPPTCSETPGLVGSITQDGLPATPAAAGLHPAWGHVALLTRWGPAPPKPTRQGDGRHPSQGSLSWVPRAKPRISR